MAKPVSTLPGNWDNIQSKLAFSLFFCAGDVNTVSVGSGTNIQDNSLVHVAKSNLSGKVHPTIIGDNVTIG